MYWSHSRIQNRASVEGHARQTSHGKNTASSSSSSVDADVPVDHHKTLRPQSLTPERTRAKSRSKSPRHPTTTASTTTTHADHHPSSKLPALPSDKTVAHGGTAPIDESAAKGNNETTVSFSSSIKATREEHPTQPCDDSQAAVVGVGVELSHQHGQSNDQRYSNHQEHERIAVHFSPVSSGKREMRTSRHNKSSRSND